MKYFFDNLSVTIKEWFQGAKEISLKKKLIALAAIILAVILVITGTSISKVKKNPMANPDYVAQNYAQNYAERKYYQAFEYSIIGKDGVDNYIKENYLSDYDSKNELSEKEHYDAINICTTLSKELSSFMSTYGIGNYDSFFGAYVETAKNIVEGYIDDAEPSDLLILECIKYSLDNYSKEYVETLNKRYNNNYSITLSEPEIKEFTEDEVQLYIENKSDLANTVFMKSGMKPNKIKAVKKYSYNVIINDQAESTITEYLVKIGPYWYVDLTSLVY